MRAHTTSNVFDFLYDQWNSKVSKLRSELRMSRMNPGTSLDLTTELWAYGIALANDLDRDEERATGSLPQRRIDARNGFFIAREFETKAFLATIGNPEDLTLRDRWEERLIAAEEALVTWIYK